MSAAILGIIGSILTIAGLFLTWYFKTEDRRRRDQLIVHIRDLEARHDEALANGDMQLVAQLQLELKRLRQETTGGAAK